MAKEYIDREALLKRLCDDNPSAMEDYYYNAIKDAPAADVVEVVHGEWDESRYPFCNFCPLCKLIIDRTCIKMNSGKLNLCPNCGAKMDGERKEV